MGNASARLFPFLHKKNMTNTPFKKGQSGNPNGRPKGSVNVAREKVKRIISDFVSSEFVPEKIQDMMKELTAKEKFDVIIKLISFVVPKPRDEEDVKSDAEYRARLLDILTNRNTKEEDDE